MAKRAFFSRRDHTAIAASIALHCCVLALLVSQLRPPVFSADVPDERTLLTSIIRIEHRPPPQVTQPRRAAAAPVVAVHTEDPPAIHVAHTIAHAARALVVAAEQRYTERSTRVTRSAKRSPAAATLVAVETPTPGEAVAATVGPAPATPTPVTVAHEDGIGNFGEDYPAKVDPGSRGMLFAGISDAVQIRVTIDESGHVVSIEFVRAPADPALVQELRNRLLAARFIPAVCNGLRCTGTVPLHN